MNGFTLPRIYPITDLRLSGISHHEQVRRFVKGGASLIQIRDKSSSTRELYEAASETLNDPVARSVKIIINDRVDVARVIGADGVHLGQEDLPAGMARRVLGEDAIIGLSTHSAKQARAARLLPVDYIAIGPIFSTSTKADPDPVVGLDGITAARDAVGDLPLVAIGGIVRANVRSVFEAGADSVAVISDIFSAGPDEISSTIADYFRTSLDA